MSSRPPPARGTGFILRAYNANLRPVVAVVALLSVIWSLISLISSFRAVNVDSNQHQSKLATFAIVLGAIYSGICGIEVFGLVSAALQRLWMVRIYAILSVLSALSVVGTGLMRVILHFVLKQELINECVSIAQGDVVVYQYGFWGPTFEDKLTLPEAQSYCDNYWSHDSFVEIISLIIEIFISVFFSSIAFAYYHQLLDPQSVANVSRVPRSEPHEEAYPSHYNPPYLGYDAPSQYAPPAGPPPDADFDDDSVTLYGGAKPPIYTADDMDKYAEDKQAKTNPFSDFDEPVEAVSRPEERDQGLV